MLIKDLKEDYPLVYEVAIDNFDEEFARDCCFYLGDEDFEEDCSIADAFNWEQTKEGFTFWNEITSDNFDKAKEICPHLFESKNEFKTDDYVVCLPKSPREHSGAGFKSNYCVKIRRVDTFVLWYYHDSGCGIYKEECRKATQEEIEEYDRIGKPYDVTNLLDKPQFEVGDWVVVLDKGCNIGNALKDIKVNKDVVKLYKSNLDNYDYNFSITPDGNSNIAFMEGEEKVYLRKALPSEILISKPVEKEVDMESILEEAKRRYPIGTKVECLVLNKPVIINGHGEKHLAGAFRGGGVYFDVKGNQTKVYEDGKWAEVLELPKKERVGKNKTSEWIKLETEEEREQADNYLKGKGFDCASSYNDYESGNKYLHIYYNKDKPYSYQFLTSLADSTYIEISKSDLGINTCFKSKVVHVDTQEEWDFVLKQENYKYIHKSTWKSHKQNSCLSLDEEGYSGFDYYKGENYQILSFHEYLSLNLLHEEWESYLSSLYSKPDEKADVNYRDYFVEGEWYIVEGAYKYLLKFEGIENSNIISEKTYAFYKEEYVRQSKIIGIDAIKSARKATKGEVEQHFPNEFDTKKKDVEFSWEVFQYPVAKEDSFNKDEFMEPIKVKPYKKSKSKIKLIF